MNIEDKNKFIAIIVMGIISVLGLFTILIPVFGFVLIYNLVCKEGNEIV